MSELTLTPPPTLSPSSIETWRQCPLKFKYTRIDGLEDPSGPEAVMGSFVHEVLEYLYALPPERRVIAEARTLAAALWKERWAEMAAPLVAERDQRQFRWQAWWCIENLFRLEDPSAVALEGIEYKFESTIGGVAVRGIIDRWSLEDGFVVIGDYKTGKTPSPRYRDAKFFQLLIYAIAISADLDLPVKRMELIYLKGGDRLQREPGVDDFESVTSQVQNVRRQIEVACEVNEFPAVPSRLCDWCSFKTTICPYWNQGD